MTETFCQIKGLGETTPKARIEGFAIQISTNEDQLASTELACFPGAVCLSFKHHVDSLENESLGRALEIQDAFHPEDILSLGLQEIAQPGVEPLGIKFPGFLNTDAGHGFVVLMVVGMPPVFVNVLGLNHHPRFFPLPGEFIESVLGEQRVAPMSGDLNPEGRCVLAQHELVNMLARHQKPARAGGHRNLLKKMGGLVFGLQQGIMNRTGMFMGMFMPVFMVVIMVVIVCMFMIMALFVFVSVGVFFLPAVAMLMLMLMVVVVVVVVVVPMGVVGLELEQDNTHDGVGSRFENQLIVAGVQMENPAPFEGELGFEEVAVERELVIQVEGMEVDDLIDRQIGLGGPENLRDPVDAANPGFEGIHIGTADQIGLVQQDSIGKSDLFLGLRGVIEVEVKMFGIDDGDNSIEAKALFHFGIAEKGLGDGTRIGEAGGFNQDVIEAVPAFEQLPKNTDEVAPDGAANASVVHLEDLFLRVDHQLVIDTDLPEFVFDHRDPPSMIFRQHAIQQGGLAGPQEAGQDGDGDAGIRSCSHKLVGNVSGEPGVSISSTG